MSDTLTREHVLTLRGDHPRYCATNLKIRTKEQGLRPLVLNRAQRIVEAKAEEQRARTGRVRIIILKARQEGISTYVASRIFRGCTLWKYKRGLVIADELKRSQEIFGFYERFRDNAPLVPEQKSGVRGRQLAWENDSRLTVETAKDQAAGRSASVQFLHGSEVGFWDHPEEVCTALFESLTPDSEAYLESTANGVGNYFHQLWEGAVTGENEWLPIFLPWWIHEEYADPVDQATREQIATSSDQFERRAQDAGIALDGEMHTLSVEQLAWRRRKIRERNGDERGFRQENPATAEEAFLVSGGAYFDEQALADYRIKTRPPIARGNLIRVESGLMFRPAERGDLRIWEMPRPDGHYVIGADTSEGKIAGGDSTLVEIAGDRGGSDFSVADVLEVGTMRQVAQLRGRMHPDNFASALWNLGYFYNCGERHQAALIAPENNHESGKTVIKWLRDHNYPRIYIHRRYTQRRESVSEQMGWVTDATTRMPMLDELAALVRDGLIEVPSADTVREMTTFVRTQDGSHPGRPEAQEGCHDDTVMSLAITNQLREHHSHGATGPMPTYEISDSPTGW